MDCDDSTVRRNLLTLVFADLPEDAEATDRFRESFEQLYTFELDKSSLDPVEALALKELFDTVVWFSPFPDERNEIPHYRDESDVRSAIRKARRFLKKTTEQ